jgi:transmembrane sensor
MARSNPQDERAGEAVECFLCLNDPDADPRARARWSAWLSENEENRNAYHAVRDAWSRPVPRDVWPAHEEILADTYDGEGPLPKRAQAPGRRSFPVATVSLASIAAVLLAAVVFVAMSGGRRSPEVASQTYRTGRGEQRRIALPDGSSIALGPYSVLSLEGGWAGGGSGGAIGGGPGRAARLEAGEAVFSVVHDPAHPFTLLANGGRIEDVGTTFGVGIVAGRATVTVVDGAVRVSAGGGAPAELSRDQQVSFVGALEPVHAVDARSETDWARGRLVYVDRPLSDVVADLDRYTTLDIQIADPSVAVLHYTGTVETDAVDHWVAALTRLFPVSADREGGRLVLRSAPKG